MTELKDEVVDVQYEMRYCSKKSYDELVRDIRVRIERIRYAKNSESSIEEDRQLSLVRVDRGI